MFESLALASETLALRVIVLAKQKLQLVSRGPPGGASVSCLLGCAGSEMYGNSGISALLTIVALSNTVLNSPTLCKIRDLGPVLVWVGVGTECAAVAVTTSRA